MGTKKARSTGSRAPLTPLEMEVMVVVWELGECMSAQVVEVFQKKRKLARTTIRTILAKLRSKGYVRPVPSIGRSYLLRPAVQRETVARRALKSLLASLFQNSPQQAIVYLLDHANISDADLEEIRRMIDSRNRKGG